MMVAAAKKFQEGAPAIGTAEPRIPHVRLASFEGIVPKTVDWRELGSENNKSGSVARRFSALLFLSWDAYSAHPLLTEDTGTQGKGGWQLEVNGERQKDPQPSSEETPVLRAIQSGTTLSYGVTDTIDFKVDMPYLRHQGILDVGGRLQVALLRGRPAQLRHASPACSCPPATSRRASAPARPMPARSASSPGRASAGSSTRTPACAPTRTSSASATGSATSPPPRCTAYGSRSGAARPGVGLQSAGRVGRLAQHGGRLHLVGHQGHRPRRRHPQGQ